MKREYKKKLTYFIKKVNSLYNYKKCIIPNTDDKNYIQLIPVVQIYHRNKKGNICVSIINHNKNLTDKFICSECGEELLKNGGN